MMIEDMEDCMSVYRLKELVNVWMEDGKGTRKKIKRRQGADSRTENRTENLKFCCINRVFVA